MSKDRMYMMAGADAEQLEQADEVFDPAKELAKLGVGAPEPLDLTEQVLEQEDDGGGPVRTASIAPDPLTGERDARGTVTVGSGINLSDAYAKERAEYQASGSDKAMRFNEGKLMYELLPAEGIEELVAIYTMGAKKYAPRNWEKGLSVTQCFGSMMRHSFAWLRGETFDKESGRHHMAHAAWNAIAIVVMWRRGKEDDRPVILDAE